jgi:hypothetical protein
LTGQRNPDARRLSHTDAACGPAAAAGARPVRQGGVPQQAVEQLFGGRLWK